MRCSATHMCPQLIKGLRRLSVNHSPDAVIKYSLGQQELRGYLNNPQGSKWMKDMHPLGSTEVCEVSKLCEDGAHETAGKDFYRERKQNEMVLK